MGITSIFTSHEKLFADWMMHHEFNQEILPETRFPEADQDKVQDSYYTIQEMSSFVTPTRDEKEAMRQMRLTQLNLPLENAREAVRKEKLGLSSHPISPDFDVKWRSELVTVEKVLDELRNSTGIAQQDKSILKQTYQIVHGPEIQRVEKAASIKDVQYGNFWGQTYFTVIEKKQSGYFLVDGWLVVSVPGIKKENFYEINDDVDITFTVKWDEGSDPVANKIAQYIQDWLIQQKEKLLTVSAASVAGATLFSVLSPRDFDINANLAVQLGGMALVMGCIAMYAMVFYSGLKLYQLHCFRDKINSIKNLGDWVKQIRRSVNDYPGFSFGAAHIGKFMTPNEGEILDNYKNQGASIIGYVSRFFQKRPDKFCQLKL